MIRSLLTTTIPVAEVGETPYAAYTNGVPQTGEYELRLAGPVTTVRIFQGALATAWCCPFLQKYLSAFQEGRKVEVTVKGSSDEKASLLCADVFRWNTWNMEIVSLFGYSVPNSLQRKLVIATTVAPLNFPKAVRLHKTNITPEYLLSMHVPEFLPCNGPELLADWESELVWVCTLKPVPTLPRQRQVAVTVWQIPDAVDIVVCAPDDRWRFHPKHIEQFPDKIKCVTLHLVGYILGYYYDAARTHER